MNNEKICSTCGTNCIKDKSSPCSLWSEIPIEQIEEKRNAFEIAQNRISKCQKILGNQSTISLISGSIKEQVTSIKIDGIIEVRKLDLIYKTLIGLYE
jgi:hypothetical protein